MLLSLMASYSLPHPYSFRQTAEFQWGDAISFCEYLRKLALIFISDGICDLNNFHIMLGATFQLTANEAKVL